MRGKHRAIRINRKSVRFRMFFSYILVLLIPLALCLVLYKVSYRAMERSSEKVYGSLLEQVRIDFDDYFDEIRQIQSRMLTDENLRSLTLAGTSFSPTEHMTLVAANRSLSQIQYTYPFIRDAIMYMKESDSVIGTTGHMSLELYYDLYLKDSDLSEENLREYLAGQRNPGDMLQIRFSDGSRRLLFSCNTISDYSSSSYSRNNSTIAILVNESLLNQRLLQFQSDPSIQIGVLTEAGDILSQAGDMDGSELTDMAFQERGIFQYVHFGGTKYAALTEMANDGRYRYILIVPMTLIQSGAREIQICSLIGLFICMFFGLYLSARLTNRNYHPLHELVRSLGAREDVQAPVKAGNEYEQVNIYLQKILQNSDQARHELFLSRQRLHKYQVYSLLERPCESFPDISGYHLKGPGYLCVLFHCSPPDEKKGSQTFRIDLLQFMIANIFQEAAGDFFDMEMTDAGENEAAIVSMASESEKVPDELLEKIAFTLQKMEEAAGVSVTAALGNIHPGLSGIYYSWHEALETADYLSQDSDILQYREIRDLRDGYRFSMEDENRLIVFVASGDEEKARESIERAEETGPKAGIPAVMNRYLAFDILSAMAKGAQQAGVSSRKIVRYDAVEQARGQEIRGTVLSMLSELCTAVREKSRANPPSSRLYEEVCRYIQENYGNPDLNISQTGLHFNLTPSYLSSLFKKESGVSLLGYINSIRIAKAKELLIRGDSVVNIAEQTGFRDSGALIRVFKKETGITPGQFRAMHARQEASE